MTGTLTATSGSILVTTQSAANASTLAASTLYADTAAALAIQGNSAGYAADTGSANTYAVTLSPAPPTLVAGLTVRFKVANTNTGASTLNVNGLGAGAIKRGDGTTALIAGDLVAGQVATVLYDGTNFQLLAMATVASNRKTRTILQSGSGTYTTPAGCKAIIFSLYGPGGGGGSSGNTSTNPQTSGSAGGNTTLSNGAGTLTAGGGLGGSTGGGAGGTASTSGTITALGTIFYTPGNPGQPGGGYAAAGATYQFGGCGGVMMFGGAGLGGWGDLQTGGGATGAGAGGGGASTGANSGGGGCGGGAGAYLSTLILNPASSYTYAIGAPGSGGTATGFYQGGSGYAGAIIADEYY